MKDHKVSVVIPAYNHEEYVGEAIQSVLDQTFQDFELIIINDGSTDNTEVEILKFKDERIRYFSQENRGLSATLNRGIELARGEYFNFLPSDDAFLPQKLEVQLEAFEKSEDIGVVFSYQKVIDAEGNEIKDDPVVGWFHVPFETKEEIFPALFERDFLSVPTALIKMGCFKKVGLFDESLKTAQDYDLWMRILKHYDLRLIKRPLLKMRWHGANLTYRPTPETEMERAKVLLKAYKNLTIEDIFPSLKQRKDVFAYAEAYEKLATYMEKSGIPALIPISQIYKNKGKHLTNSKVDLAQLEERGTEIGIGMDPERDTNGKINILMEARSLDKGGMEEVVYNIATHLDADLFRVIVVCIERGGFVEGRLRKVGIPVEILGQEKEREYREILRRYRIDLVNTHYSHFGPPIASQEGIPVLSFIHSIYNWVSNKLFDEFRRVDPFVSKYIAVSKIAEQYARYRFNIPPEKFKVIPDGINLGRLSGPREGSVPKRKDLGMDEEDFIFLHVGAISRAKMHNSIIAALKSLPPQFSSIKVLCLGQILEEDYYQFIQRKIEENGLEGRIKFLGFIEDIQPYYQLADAFLLPSLIEGWGLVTLEAMYYGLPLILTRVGGAEEFIKDGDIGILISNCWSDIIQLDESSFQYFAHLDYPSNTEEFVNALVDFYTRKEHWKEAGKKGREKVLSQFTLDRVMPSYEKEYLSLAIEGKNFREIKRIRSIENQLRIIEEERIKTARQFQSIQNLQKEVLEKMGSLRARIQEEIFNKVQSVEGQLRYDKNEILRKLGLIEYQINYMLRRISLKERIKDRWAKTISYFKKRLPLSVKKVLKRLYYRVFPEKKNKTIPVEKISYLDGQRVYENLILNARHHFAEKEGKSGDALLMERLLSKPHERIVIYPPTLNWGFHLFQRPHQVFRALAERGYLSFFCIPDPEQDGVDGLREVQPNLLLCGNVALLHHFLRDQEVIIWATWTPHKIFFEYFPKARLIYDYIDELNVFYGFSPSMEEDHQALLQRADWVLTTSTSLLEKVKAFRPDALLVPNGVYLEDFKHSHPPSPPKDLMEILERGKPILGYYGALAEWLDYELINYVVLNCPLYNVVLIGPDYDGSKKNLLNSKNLFCLGSKMYEELKNYLYYFDVAFIPFKISEVTNSTSPLKLFEFMAGGKPIVTTDVKECRKYRSVYVAKNKEDFIKKIDLAFEKRKDPSYLKMLKEESEENSWHSRVELVIEQFLKGGSKR